MEGKQTAVLAPTTVLVLQHYKTLQKRFSAFPARIEMLSRFRTAKEQREIVKALEAGTVGRSCRDSQAFVEGHQVQRPRPAGSRRRTTLPALRTRANQAASEEGRRDCDVRHPDPAGH